MNAQGPSTVIPLPSGSQSADNTGFILGIIFGVLGFILLATGMLMACFCQRRRQKAGSAKPIPPPDRSQTSEVLHQLKRQEFDCDNIEFCLDQYGRVIEIGTGGFGQIVMGVRDGVQPVAIKRIIKSDNKAREDFLKEIKLLKHISLDANIVQYFGASIQEDHLWLVTEYMEGGDLRRALSASDQNRLTWWNGGKQIALDVARGLAFLHSRQVVHRDIKSHNILLTREGRAKIADVGMALITNEDNCISSIRSQQGTFAWASPELLLKDRQCTEKIDIYSFGVCLWEIVTSQIPQRGEMFCPSPEECPTAVTALIQECMQRDPRDRPSAKEIYRRLRACEPLRDDSDHIILDSAEAGGRRSRAIDRAQQSVHAYYNLGLMHESPPLQPFSYDSPMSTHEEAARGCWGIKEEEEEVHQPDGCLQEGCIAKACSPDGPLPTSNEAFTQLVAKYSQAGTLTSTTDCHTHPEDIMATGSVDADLSHIPSIYDSIRLPESMLTTDESRFLDHTQTQSSEDLVLATHSLTFPSKIHQTCSTDELVSHRLSSSAPLGGDFARGRGEEESEDEEDGDDQAVAVASVQGFAGSSKATSRLTTGSSTTSSLHTGSNASHCESDSAAGPPNSPVCLSDALRELREFSRLTFPSEATVTREMSLSLPSQKESIHTGDSTGSTVFYEDAEEAPSWLKTEVQLASTA